MSSTWHTRGFLAASLVAALYRCVIGEPAGRAAKVAEAEAEAAGGAAAAMLSATVPSGAEGPVCRGAAEIGEEDDMTAERSVVASRVYAVECIRAVCSR